MVHSLCVVREWWNEIRKIEPKIINVQCNWLTITILLHVAKKWIPNVSHTDQIASAILLFYFFIRPVVACVCSVHFWLLPDVWYQLVCVLFKKCISILYVWVWPIPVQTALKSLCVCLRCLLFILTRINEFVDIGHLRYICVLPTLSISFETINIRLPHCECLHKRTLDPVICNNWLLWRVDWPYLRECV